MSEANMKATHPLEMQILKLGNHKMTVELDKGAHRNIHFTCMNDPEQSFSLVTNCNLLAILSLQGNYVFELDPGLLSFQFKFNHLMGFFGKLPKGDIPKKWAEVCVASPQFEGRSTVTVFNRTAAEAWLNRTFTNYAELNEDEMSPVRMEMVKQAIEDIDCSNEQAFRHGVAELPSMFQQSIPEDEIVAISDGFHQCLARMLFAVKIYDDQKVKNTLLGCMEAIGAMADGALGEDS